MCCSPKHTSKPMEPRSGEVLEAAVVLLNLQTGAAMGGSAKRVGDSEGQKGNSLENQCVGRKGRGTPLCSNLSSSYTRGKLEVRFPKAPLCSSPDLAPVESAIAPLHRSCKRGRRGARKPRSELLRGVLGLKPKLFFGQHTLPDSPHRGPSRNHPQSRCALTAWPKLPKRGNSSYGEQAKQRLREASKLILTRGVKTSEGRHWV